MSDCKHGTQQMWSICRICSFEQHEETRAKFAKLRSALVMVPELVRARCAAQSAHEASIKASYDGDHSFEDKCDARFELEKKIAEDIDKQIADALAEASR